MLCDLMNEHFAFVNDRPFCCATKVVSVDVVGKHDQLFLWLLYYGDESASGSRAKRRFVALLYPRYSSLDFLLVKQVL